MLRLKLYGAAVLAALIAIFSFGAMRERKGADDARTKAVQEDLENAQDISVRVSRGRDERMRELDDAGYRRD